LYDSFDKTAASSNSLDKSFFFLLNIFPIIL
jgi:hypothetical protein